MNEKKKKKYDALVPLPFFQALKAFHLAAMAFSMCSFHALVPLPVFQALKAFHLAAVAFSTCSFHHQVSQHQWLGWVVPHNSSDVLSSPVLMLFQISSVAASVTPADMLTCKLKTSWKWLLVWGSLSFQTLRRGVNLRLDFGGTSILMSHTRSWCCRASSLPGITFTSVKSLHMVLRKRMKSVCMAMFPDLYLMRWLSRFLKHVFPRSRSKARAYSRVLSPSTSGSSLSCPMHFPVSSACTAYMAVPIYTWEQKFNAGILAVTVCSWSKNRSLTTSLRPLCRVYTDRNVTTHWLTVSFTKMSLLETLCSSKKYIDLLNHYLDCWYVKDQSFFWCEHQPVLWPWGQSHRQRKFIVMHAFSMVW